MALTEAEILEVGSRLGYSQFGARTSVGPLLATLSSENEGEIRQILAKLSQLESAQAGSQPGEGEGQPYPRLNYLLARARLVRLTGLTDLNRAP